MKVDTEVSGFMMDTFLVNIHPLPLPYLTSFRIYGCQVFDTLIKEGIDTSWFYNQGECIRACAGSKVTYTAHGFSGSTFTITKSGGTIVASNSISKTIKWPDNPGMGSITVTETTIYGCKRSVTQCIEIIEKPNAKCDVTRNLKVGDTACLYENVYFKDKSTGSSSSPIMNWHWNFGDGTSYTSSTFSNPVHAYTTSGQKNAFLVVTNACNCRDTFHLPIFVKDLPGIRIQCPSVLCFGDTGYYSINIDQFECPISWEASGGNVLSGTDSTVEIVWNNIDSSGFGYVTAETQCGNCPGKITTRVPVIKSSISFSDTSLLICDSIQKIYRLPAWPGTTFNWSLDPQSSAAIITNTDQPNEIVVNTNGTGEIIIRCEYTCSIAGCSGSAEIRPHVVSRATVDGPTLACEGGSATYTLTNNYSTNWHWQVRFPGGTAINRDTNSTSITINGLIAGTYTINVITSNFCPPMSINLVVTPKPADIDTVIGSLTVCRGVPYEYKAGNGIPGTIFKWSGTNVIFNSTADTATGKNVTAVFQAGTLSMKVVRVSTKSPYCKSDIKNVPITPEVINPAITGDSLVCPDSHENYSTSYTTGETYEWSIEDSRLGSVASGDNTTAVDILWNHTAVTDTTYVILKVRKCQTTVIDSLRVILNAIPSFSLSNDSTICRGASLPVTLSSTPALTSGNITWSFGDGTIVTTSAPTLNVNHSYSSIRPDTAQYTITAVVSLANGCLGSTASVSSTVKVYPAPVIYLSPQGPFYHCFSFSDTLTATLQNGFGATDSLKWTTPAGNPSCGTPLPCSTQVATTPGSYFVTAVGANGCKANSNTVQITHHCDTSTCTISPEPVITFTQSQSCGAISVTAHPQGGFSHIWAYPPGLIVVTNDTLLTTHVTTAGMYDFTFSACYLDVNSDTCCRQKKITVTVPLAPHNLRSVACNGSGYQLKVFDHTNYFPSAVIDSFRVKVDTIGHTISTQSGTATSYIFNLQPGVYIVTETVFFTYGGASSSCATSDTIILSPLPIAAFTFATNNSCEGVPIYFSNQSSNYVSSFWNFGDIAMNTLDSVQRVYSAASPFYNSVLTVTNSQGCKDSVTHTVSIKANGTVEMK